MEASVTSIAEHTSQARSLTGDPIWRAAEFIPFLGGNLTAVREIAEVIDDTADQVVAPLVEVSGSIDPSSFAPKDGAIDLSPLTAATEPVNKANDSMQAILERARAIPEGGTIAPIEGARAELVGMLEEYAGPLSTLDGTLPLLPGVLGAEGPRTYILMFQNPAEPRALGGSALSFSALQLDQGKISIGQSVAASTGAFRSYAESVIPIPDGAEAVYPNGEFGTFIAEASARPSFTTAAQIVKEMWFRQFGQEIDGVISIDPVALGYMLRATGPITTSGGESLDSDNLVGMLLNWVYLHYASYPKNAANAMHDLFYADVVSSVFSRLTSGPLDASQLVGALAQGWNERRILFWSANAGVEEQLAAIGLNGELPVTDEATVRAGLYFQDSVGSKLSYYLRQKVQLSEGTCSEDGTRTFRVQAELTNTIDGAAATTMPFHITGEWAKEGLYPGLNRLTMRLYAPPGSTITGAAVDGAPIQLDAMHDTDYPVGKTRIEVAPGATVTLTYEFTMPPGGQDGFEVQLTPLVSPTAVETTPLDCAASVVR